MIRIVSFSYKLGQKPAGADILCDCRDWPNPHSVPELRRLTGRDDAVKTFVQQSKHFGDEMSEILHRVQDGDLIAFGCVGGRHRSVAAAEMMTARLRDEGHTVEMEHLAI